MQETMGRLDDAAKHKVVELRKAGLSFRKIKAVLELENIKVSAQAIYLFLREYHGRPPGRVRPLEAGSTSSPTPPQVQPRTGTTREQWSNVLLQNLRGEASHCAGFTGTQNFTKQTSLSSDTSTKPGCGEISESSSVEQRHEGDKEENDIQIVSVTSLAQNRQQINLQSTVRRAEVTPGSPALTSAALMRRRITPSPATNSMLAARKRLLDKALSHKMKVCT